MTQKATEEPYVIRIVGEPDHDQFEKYGRYDFGERGNFENLCGVLDKHGVDYTPQMPIEGNGGTGR